MASRSGQQFSIACAVVGLACVAADRSQGDRSQGDRSQGDRSQGDRSQGDRTQGERAAGLHGLAQGFRDRPGRPGQELAARYQQASLAMLRAQLGPERFDRAYAAGLALPADQALRSGLLSPPGSRRPG